MMLRESVGVSASDAGSRGQQIVADVNSAQVHLDGFGRYCPTLILDTGTKPATASVN
jgi:hypothetical protein